MRIALVVAMTPERVIGRQGALPWRLPADMRHFRRTTMGHPVIMGRRTHESIGTPLEGRTNIVLTRRRDYAAAGCLVAHTADEALELAASSASVDTPSVTSMKPSLPDEVMVIGGASIYAAFLERAQRLYVTLVHAALEGDTYFPPIELDEWREVERTEAPADDKNAYAQSYVVYER